MDSEDMGWEREEGDEKVMKEVEGRVLEEQEREESGGREGRGAEGLRGLVAAWVQTGGVYRMVKGVVRSCSRTDGGGGRGRR